MKQKVLETYKDKLSSLKEEAVKLRQLHLEESQTYSTGSMDVIDEANVMQDKGMALERLETDNKKMRLIDAALQRIEDGVFGECQYCGDKISPERLSFIPYAKYCKDCKEELEKEGKSHY